MLRITKTLSGMKCGVQLPQRPLTSDVEGVETADLKTELPSPLEKATTTFQVAFPARTAHHPTTRT
jgi:hypothetical protein